MLRHNAAFRAFWGARTISYFGDKVAAVALVTLVYEREGGGVAVGSLLLAEVLPQLGGPFAGALADRADPRRVMIACDIGRAVLFGIAAVLLPPFPVLLGLVFLAGVCGTLFLPAGRGTVPALVPPDDLTRANATLGAALNTAIAVGPAVGGVIVAAAGVRGALLLDVASFLASALLVTRLPAVAREATTPTGGFLAETRQGLRFLAGHRTARAVAIGLFVLVLFGALDNVALVFLARDTLGADAAGYGFFAASYGVGMVLAPLALSRLGGRAAPAWTLLGGVAANGVGLLLTGLAPSLPLAVAAQTLAGAGNGFENVANDTLIGRSVPRPLLGRVFGTVYSGASVASGLAYAAGGPLLAATSPRVLFLIAAGGVFLAFAVLWVLLPRDRR